MGSAVMGEDFFGREIESDILLEKIVDGDHVLLTGQRRFGKISIARELGLRLKKCAFHSRSQNQRYC